MKKSLALLSFASIVLLFAGLASATSITVDENGNGLPYHLGPDPGPGGLSSTLIYTLPFLGVVGDVELIEPETGIPGDVIRFNGDGTLIYYSTGNAPNTPALADEPGPPFPVPNTVVLTEITGGATFYTPSAGQPGYDASAAPAYGFQDFVAAVPEPSSIALMFLAGAALIAGKLRKRAIS